jgi:hypothetical protein
MAYTLDEFVADCRRIFKADSGPAGREAVRTKLQDLLMNDNSSPLMGGGRQRRHQSTL